MMPVALGKEKDGPVVRATIERATTHHSQYCMLPEPLLGDRDVITSTFSFIFHI